MQSTYEHIRILLCFTRFYFRLTIAVRHFVLWLGTIHDGWKRIMECNVCQ